MFDPEKDEFGWVTLINGNNYLVSKSVQEDIKDLMHSHKDREDAITFTCLNGGTVSCWLKDVFVVTTGSAKAVRERISLNKRINELETKLIEEFYGEQESYPAPLHGAFGMNRRQPHTQ